MFDLLWSYIVDVNQPSPPFMTTTEFDGVQQITFPTGPIPLNLVELARTQLATEVLPLGDARGPNNYLVLGLFL
jgi:hypothetical protein